MSRSTRAAAISKVSSKAIRRDKRAAGQETRFKSLGYPLTNYVCLVFLAGILYVMFLTPGLRISVYLSGIDSTQQQMLLVEIRTTGIGRDQTA